ncbi:MAG TPA: YncE family protein [Rudaea sp.]|jgi:DNA-binding beta-propeller fold protein YncE|nr:YncE family protein [Rudaea sp.]
MFAAAALLVSMTLSGADAPYHQIGSVPLGDGERWDYVTFDPASRHVFVAHGDRVEVVDTDAGKIIGTVSDIPGGTHGIALSPDAKLAVTDDGHNGQAIVFDPNTFHIIRRIATSEDADGLFYDASKHRVVEINGDNGTLSLIDPTQSDVASTIRLGEPLEAGLSDGHGTIYVLGVDQHEVIRVSANGDTRRFVLDGCERPHGLAMDVARKTLFATCANKTMTIIDGENGRRLASVPIGAGSDGAVFDAKRGVAISSNGEGTLTVVRAADHGKFDVVATVPTARSARTIAIDESSGRLFLPAADVDPDASVTAGTSKRPTYKKGSLRLLIFAPTR